MGAPDRFHHSNRGNEHHKQYGDTNEMSSRITCHLICQRFIKQRQQKVKGLDRYISVYDKRVVKKLTGMSDKSGYRRCSKCDIVLKSDKCPCCGATILTVRSYKGGHTKYNLVKSNGDIIKIHRKNGGRY